MTGILEFLQQPGTLALASALLQGSGPSRTPQSIGGLLGQGLMAYQAGNQIAAQNKLQNELLQQQVAQGQNALNEQQAFKDTLQGIGGYLQAGQDQGSPITPSEISKFMLSSPSAAGQKFGLDLMTQAPPKRRTDFGIEREAFADEMFGKSFVDLNSTQKSKVNQAVQRNKVGRTEFDPTAINKKSIEKAQEAVLDTNGILGAVEDIEKIVRENRGAVGVPGAGREFLGGIAGGLADIAQGTFVEDPLRSAESAINAQVVSDLKTRARFLVGRLKPIVTNETGKFTDREQKEVEKIVKALETSTTSEQILSAMNATKDIIRNRDREARKVLTGKIPGQKFRSPLIQGEITEQDILDTMKNRNLSREEVMRQLQIE